MRVLYLLFYLTLFGFCMFVSFVFTFLFDSLLFLYVFEFRIYFFIWLSFVSIPMRVLYLLFNLALFCFCMFVNFVFNFLLDSLLFLYECEFWCMRVLYLLSNFSLFCFCMYVSLYLLFNFTLFCFCMIVSFVFTSLCDSLLFLYVCEFCIYFFIWLSFVSIRMRVLYLIFYLTFFCFCMFVCFVFTSLFDSLLFLHVCEVCIYIFIRLSFVSVWIWVLKYESFASTL